MRTAALPLAALVALSAGCQTLGRHSGSRSLANAPCDGRIIGAVLNSTEPLTRDEIAYLNGCGVRFAAAR